MTDTYGTSLSIADLPCASLENVCLLRWFALDLAADRRGCPAWEACACGGDAPFSAALCLAPECGATVLLDELGALGSDAPVVLRSVVCSAACDALLSGDGVWPLVPSLRDQLAMLLGDPALPVEVRAALLLRRGLLALIIESDGVAARPDFVEGEQAAVDAGSLALQLVHRTLIGMVDCLAGAVTRAEARLSDSEILCAAEGAGPLPRLLVFSAQGVVSLMQGDAQRAATILDQAAAMPEAEEVGAAVTLPLLAHRTYAAADLGQREMVATLSRRLGEQVIPAHRGLLEAYRHLALGVLALRLGQPQQALIRAQESVGRDENAQLPAMLGRVLQIQALVDLNRGSEARAFADTWIPRWTERGLHRLAAVVGQEQAMFEMRAGEYDRARRTLQAARERVPAGELLVPLHRNRVWLTELESALLPSAENRAALPARVQIRTLGEFVVEIDGRRIYDRDWKGKRTRMLLIALICAGGQKVPAERLADMLWPDSEGAQAMQNLKVTLHRLRRLGRQDGEPPLNWVHVKHGLVSLPKIVCRIDVHEQVFRGQASDFLPGEHTWPWVQTFREMLAARAVTDLEPSGSYT